MLNPGLWQSSKYGGLHVAVCWAKDGTLTEWPQWAAQTPTAEETQADPEKPMDGKAEFIRGQGGGEMRRAGRFFRPCLLLFPGRPWFPLSRSAPPQLQPLSREALPTEARRVGGLGPPPPSREDGLVTLYNMAILCVTQRRENRNPSLFSFFKLFSAVPGLHSCKGSSLVAGSGPLSSCGAGASHRGGPCGGAQA